MAMIRCFECGKEISDSAERCPHCGCVTSSGETKSQAKAILVQWVISAIALFAGIMLFISGIGSFSIIKMVIGVALALGGVIDIVILNFHAAELRDKTVEKSVAVIGADGNILDEADGHVSYDRKGNKVVKADGTVVYDNGQEWRCPACKYDNPSSLIRCYNCGRRKPE